MTIEDNFAAISDNLKQLQESIQALGDRSIVFTAHLIRKDGTNERIALYGEAASLLASAAAIISAVAAHAPPELRRNLIKHLFKSILEVYDERQNG